MMVMLRFYDVIICTVLVLGISGKTPLTGYLQVAKGCVCTYIHTSTYIFSIEHIYMLHRHEENLCFRKPDLEFCHP